MERRMIKYKLFVLVLISMVVTSCYYDNEEYLYPGLNGCDVTAVSFSQHIEPVISNTCTSCHTGAGASAGIRLANHTEIVAAINTGRFMGAVKHEAGFSPMPQGAPKLDECSVKRLEAWIAAGMPAD
jgi:hypothetical protein